MAKNSKSVQQKADAKRASERNRNWTLIFYPDDLPDDWVETVNSLHVKWVKSPLHDRDLRADGSPKKPHYHTLFMFNKHMRLTQIKEVFKGLFGEGSTGSIVGVAEPKIVQDRCGLVRYMAHLDDPDKAQYDVADIVGYNGADPAEILKYSATETRAMIVAMEEFIEDKGITELADLSKSIRYDYPDWHTILATKMTVYFNNFIRSRRHIAREQRDDLSDCVDPVTGEILEEVQADETSNGNG